MSEENEEDSNRPMFSSSIGTVMRVSNGFERIDDFYRIRDYKSALFELELLYKNISPFTSTINKTSGEIIKKPEYNILLGLKNKCASLINKCTQPSKDNKNIFLPTNELILSIEEYDFYIRAIALKNHIYMTMLDNEEEDVGLLARRPRINYGRRL